MTPPGTSERPTRDRRGRVGGWQSCPSHRNPLHLALGEPAAVSLAVAIAAGIVPGSVLAILEDPSHGPLGHGDAWKALLERLDRDRPDAIVVWSGDNASEATFLAMVAAWLDGRPEPLLRVAAPGREGRPYVAVHSPEDLGAALPDAHPPRRRGPPRPGAGLRTHPRERGAGAPVGGRAHRRRPRRRVRPAAARRLRPGLAPRGARRGRGHGGLRRAQRDERRLLLGAPRGAPGGRPRRGRGTALPPRPPGPAGPARRAGPRDR